MVLIREFVRDFKRYRQQAEAGKAIHLIDRATGKKFTFAADKSKSFVGAARHLAKGKPLSAKPTPKSEWGESY